MINAYIFKLLEVDVKGGRIRFSCECGRRFWHASEFTDQNPAIGCRECGRKGLPEDVKDRRNNVERRYFYGTKQQSVIRLPDGQLSEDRRRKGGDRRVFFSVLPQSSNCLSTKDVPQMRRG